MSTTTNAILSVPCIHHVKVLSAAFFLFVDVGHSKMSSAWFCNNPKCGLAHSNDVEKCTCGCKKPRASGQPAFVHPAVSTGLQPTLEPFPSRPTSSCTETSCSSSSCCAIVFALLFVVRPKMKKNEKKACQKECLLLTLLPRTLFFFRAGTATCTQGRFLSFGEEADAIPSGSRANAGKTAWAAYPTVRRQSSNPGQCRLGTIVVFLLKRKTGSIETPALTRPIRWAPSEL